MKKHLLSLFICLGISLSGFAQSENEIISSLDTTAFDGRIFLNKGGIIKEFVDPFIKKDKDNAFINMSARHFKYLYESLGRSSFEEKKAKPNKIDKFYEKSDYEIERNNVIPIGILVSDAILLSEEEIKENQKNKKEGKKVEKETYKTINIYTPCLLQDYSYQNDLYFELSKDLVKGKQNSIIKGIEIDFQDGKGWQAHQIKDELIHHRFLTTGNVAIGLKLITKDGEYITYNTLNIKTETVPKSDLSGTVSAVPEITETNRNAKVQNTVSGANYWIYNGCDGVLDKPIIIAEGFDINREVGELDLYVKYYDALTTFRIHGYDLVFVSYQNARDHIENNAQALKAVINTINNQKTGNHSLTLVGESMSGLVARYALKQMENDGQNHNVGKFISFDAPHQGANVPPGLIAARRSIGTLTGWLSPFAWIFSPAVRAIDQPAAEQLLLYSTSSLTRHWRFDDIRNKLNNLGNGGYPINSKNIALINGRLDGGIQNFDGQAVVPGNSMLDLTFNFILANGNLNARYNLVNNNTQVFNGYSVGIFNIFGSTSAWFNSNKSLDRLSGGFISAPYDFPNSWTLNGNLNARFSFVPTFSSIDYKGPLNNDANHTININNMIGSNFQVLTGQQNLTPFQAIYGRSGVNTQHSDPSDVKGAWDILALQEFGISQYAYLSTCTIPVPPVVKQRVMINQGRGRSFAYVNLPSTIYFKPKYRALPDPNTITLAIPGDGSVKNYNQFIQITGPGFNSGEILLPRSGLFDFNYKDLNSGVYTVTSKRRYFGVFSSEKTNSTSFTMVDNSNLRTFVSSDCPDVEKDGEILGVLSSTNETVYAIRYNNQWLAILEDGTFVPRSELIANGINSYGADCFVQVDPASPTPNSTCSSLGSITYQRWNNIGGGNAMSDLITNTNYFQNAPSVTQNINSFSAPSNVGDNHGSRIRGYVCPPISGKYTFWVSGDDHTELWLSTSEDPNYSQRIAYHNAWTPSNEWSWYDTQKSGEIQLQAGNRYFIEARVKEGYGGDNLDVGWQLPNGALERPIQGNRLSPYSGTTNSCDFNIQASNTNANPSPGQGLNLSYSCTGADCSGVSYTWSGQGINGNQTPKSINAPSSAGSYTYTITGVKNGCTKTANTYLTVGTTTCGISDGQSLGVWTPNPGLNIPLKARIFNNQLWVTQVMDVNDPNNPYAYGHQEAFTVRGRNILTRSDVATSYAASYTCFAGGDTDIGGLVPPVSATPFSPSIPSYTYTVASDGYKYYYTDGNVPPPPSTSLSVLNISIPSNCDYENGTKKYISYSVSGGSGEYQHEFGNDGTWWNGNALLWNPVWGTSFNFKIRDKNNTSLFVNLNLNTGNCGQSGSWSLNNSGNRIGIAQQNSTRGREQIESFKIFPNPVENELEIKMSDTEKIKRVTIFNIKGEKYLEIDEPVTNKFNVSLLKPGLYVLKVETLDTIEEHKFIKL